MTSSSVNGSDRGGRPQDPRERLAGGDPIDEADLVEWLCADQVHRWRAGERIPAEAYLAAASDAARWRRSGLRADLRRVPHPRVARRGAEARGVLLAVPCLRRSAAAAARAPPAPSASRRPRPKSKFDGDAGPDRDDGLTVPMVPGFEILGILGQGGMSVVYLARQVALNRLVALKVIRGRVYADPEIADPLPRRGRGRRAVPASQYHPGVRGR